MSENHIDVALGTAYSDSLFDGTRDTDTGIYYRVKGYGTDFYKNIVRMVWSLAQVSKLGKSFRIYKDSGDGALQFSITGGKFWYGDTQVTYAGATARNLTAGVTNLISILTDNTLDIDTTWPTDPHLKVAQIVTSATTWVIVNDLTDLRPEQIFRVSGAIRAKELTDVADLLEVTVPNITGASPQSIEVTVADKGGTAAVTAKYFVVSCHNDVNGGDPYATNATIAIGANGTKILDLIPSKELFCKTNATGALTVTVTKPTTGAVYVMTRPYRLSGILDCADYGTVTIT